MRTGLHQKHGWYLTVLVLVTVSGCTTLHQEAPSASRPVFALTDSDRAEFVGWAQELDKVSLSCTEATCDEITYTKGLVALFESQQTARTLLEPLASKLPTSSIGESSALWLHVLDTEQNGLSHPSMVLLAQLVRESIRRTLNNIQTRDLQGVPGTVEPKPREAGTLRTVQRQLKERDRRIAELTAQLEALKTIDHDAEHRTKPLRVPSQVAPLYEH
ncbi:MAG TPA: hypothetical protein VJ746_16370 [Nitrospira sp.]|nr:hypothetical protein [Nitrospira sp.]